MSLQVTGPMRVNLATSRNDSVQITLRFGLPLVAQVFLATILIRRGAAISGIILPGAGERIPPGGSLDLTVDSALFDRIGALLASRTAFSVQVRYNTPSFAVTELLVANATPAFASAAAFAVNSVSTDLPSDSEPPPSLDEHGEGAESAPSLPA